MTVISETNPWLGIREIALLEVVERHELGHVEDDVNVFAFTAVVTLVSAIKCNKNI